MQGETNMLRKTLIAVAAAAAIGALAPTGALAAPGHHGGHSFHRAHHGHSLHRGSFRVVTPLFVSCWRWVPSRFGLVKVWVCG